MNKLSELIEEIEKVIPTLETINLAVSASSVGWHAEHTLLTINRIIDQLKVSDPARYQWSFSFPRLLVFTLKKIPRGRAKAPEVVVPKHYDTASLRIHLANTLEKLQELDAIQADRYFEHPFFGKLKRDQTITFLEIHTHHHVNIMKDILAK